MQYVHQMIVNGFILLYGCIKGHIDNFIVANTNHHITLTIKQSLNTSGTHTTSNNAVMSCRTTTTLQMSKNRDTYIKLRELIMYTLCIVHCTTEYRIL